MPQPTQAPRPSHPSGRPQPRPAPPRCLAPAALALLALLSAGCAAVPTLAVLFPKTSQAVTDATDRAAAQALEGLDDAASRQVAGAWLDGGNDADPRPDDAPILARGPRREVVRQTFRPVEAPRSPGLTLRRRSFVLQTADGLGRAIGEGPVEAAGQVSPDEHRTTTLRSRIGFTGDPAAPVRLELTLLEAIAPPARRDSPAPDARAPLAAATEAAAVDPDLEIRQDYLLAGPLPAKLRSVGRPYLLAAAGDRLSDLAARRARWTPGYLAAPADARAAIRALWLREMESDNPRLVDRLLDDRQRVDLPDYETEILPHLEAILANAASRRVPAPPALGSAATP